MFFTEVVIDASNILALIFYNKMDVCVTTTSKISLTGQPPPPCAPYVPATNLPNEKDISGGFVSAFNPSVLLSQDFFNKASQQVAPSSISPVASAILGPIYVGAKLVGWLFGPSKAVPTSLIMGIIIVSGLIMLFAAYAFFIAAISFLGRLIELWVLIIFSPFAFMSSTIPILNDIEYIGWKAWLHRLLTVAFMAPIFMFFMYVIFLIVHANIFSNIARGNATGTTNPQTWGEIMIFVIVGAMVLLILLLKAADFAKKGAGKLGEMLIKGTEIAMGATLGLGLGATAVGLQATLGRAGAAVANSERAKRWESQGRFGAKALRSVAKYGATSSFDARKGAVGGILAAAGSVSGLDLGHKTKYFMKEAGGFETDRKRAVEKRIKRAKSLEVGEDEGIKQNVREAEANLNAAKSNPATQEALVRLNEGDRTAEATANANLTTANANLATNPADPALIAARDAALAALATAQGLGPLERAAATGQRGLADAERSLKDAIAEHGTTSTEANDARTVQATALAERERTRINLENRQQDIRIAGAEIHNAEVALKRAQNVEIAENRTRKMDYIANMPGTIPWGRMIRRGLLGTTIIERTAGDTGAARREAANKIRADIQEEKK